MLGKLKEHNVPGIEVDPNPLVPSAYDVVWGAVMLVLFVLAIEPVA